MKPFSLRSRKNNLRDLERDEFDLVIIGGGINGAGVARDAAMRGMKVGLIEARDFASGTSSRSSKLIHGGIRYLENLEFKLVFEALSERSRLFGMAPHLVHPLRFMIPLYEDSRVGFFKMGLGMWLYDLLALFQTPEIHEKLNRFESLQRMPILKAHHLLGSYVYSDAYMDDDRLVFETLRSANEAGACCANYVSAVGAEFDSSNQLHKILCEDQRDRRKFYIRSKKFVSTVGPWTDQLGSIVDSQWKKILRPTKGIHLTLSRSRLPMSCAVVMAAEKSDRIVFGIPRNEMIIVGTTDTDYKESPENVSVTVEDVTYLLKVLRDYFPGAKLSPEDIVSCYAGVRPLVQDGSAKEGKTSREHTIFTDKCGLTYVAGGKYTTYRLIASQVVDHILKGLPLEDKVRFSAVNTAIPLNPFTGPDEYEKALFLSPHWNYSENLSATDQLLLAERYGLEAENLIRQNNNFSYIELEAIQSIENTMCLHLTDFFARRVPHFLSRSDHGLNYLHEVGEIFKERLGWTQEQLQEEKQNYKNYIESQLNWKKLLGP